ncbi:MAG TPA: host attachment protein [Chthoniobacterales bacterium]|nr:host attachment protein [Chthoniobacterales bacterium]
MTPTSLVIVADRGNLKAYKVDETPTRGASLQLVQALELTDAHGRYKDKFTDNAGRFPVGDGGGQAGSGRHMNGIAERQALETENDRRLHKQLADHVEEIIRAEAPEGWSFAAPASINSTVVDLLTSDIRNRIVENVKSDLVNIEAAKLPTHFQSLQPV